MRPQIEHAFQVGDILSLKGNFLLAAPSIPDERFKQAIIFICEKSKIEKLSFNYYSKIFARAGFSVIHCKKYSS